MEPNRAADSDGESSIFSDAERPAFNASRHLLLRAAVIACFLFLALFAAASVLQIYRMAGMLTAPVLGYLVAVPGTLLVFGLVTAVLLTMGRALGWHIALGTAICMLGQQLVGLAIQVYDGADMMLNLRWPLWLAGTVITILLLTGRQFRTAFGVGNAAFRTAALAWSAMALGLALLLQSF